MLKLNAEAECLRYRRSRDQMCVKVVICSDYLFLAARIKTFLLKPPRIANYEFFTILCRLANFAKTKYSTVYYIIHLILESV